MIAEPPSLGATQEIATLVPETVLDGAAGTLGTVGKIAPPPYIDAAEFPTEFVAKTLA